MCVASAPSVMTVPDDPWMVSDGTVTPAGRELLQGIAQVQYAAHYETLEQVSRKYLGERAEPHDRVWPGALATPWCCFAVACKDHFAAANDNHDHASDAGLARNTGTESFNRVEGQGLFREGSTQPSCERQDKQDDEKLERSATALRQMAHASIRTRGGQ